VVSPALASAAGRASLISAIYIVSYAASGIPVVIGGIATSHDGLHDTALIYSFAVAALAAVAAGLLVRRIGAAGRPDQGAEHLEAPPGPGTCPPCAPITPRSVPEAWHPAGVSTDGRL
jgi:hypothetical protein